MRPSHAALAVLMLGLAGPAWGTGLELIIEGREAELAGRREAALTAYAEATGAADLTNPQGLGLGATFLARSASSPLTGGLST